MTTIYTQHTVGAVYVSETGHQHYRTEPDDTQVPTSLDCTACEPYLVKEGWVYNTELVPLTERQERERDRVEREGNMAVKQVAEALAETAAAALTKGSRAEPAEPAEPVSVVVMAPEVPAAPVKRGPGRPRKNPVPQA